MAVNSMSHDFFNIISREEFESLLKSFSATGLKKQLLPKLSGWCWVKISFPLKTCRLRTGPAWTDML